MQKDAADKEEIGMSEFEHHQQGEIGVSPERYQHKSVPSSSTQPERTSKSSLDGDEIKNYINKCDVNAIDNAEGHDDDLEKEHCSDLKDLERTDWSTLEAYKGKLSQQTGLVNEIPFVVDYVQSIPQDCGVFVCAYAEILSEGQLVHSHRFDDGSQHARYTLLLWHYEVKKENKRYTSDNGDPPRPRNSVLEEIDANAIVTLE
ncbi:hypothetical protein FXO37_02636 [Capsicum annuum]|nr:hypothetical protein FXO37_02636 [Capsicum annuum]